MAGENHYTVRPVRRGCNRPRAASAHSGPGCSASRWRQEDSCVTGPCICGPGRSMGDGTKAKRGYLDAAQMTPGGAVSKASGCTRQESTPGLDARAQPGYDARTSWTMASAALCPPQPLRSQRRPPFLKHHLHSGAAGRQGSKSRHPMAARRGAWPGPASNR